MFWFAGQVIANLSPSIEDSIRVTDEEEEDIFSALLESSDQGPLVLDELPEVREEIVKLQSKPNQD